jgi:hypothetical protein
MQVDVLKTREEFAFHKKSLFESGALREIFVGEKATVYSLADSCYGIVLNIQKPGEGNQYFLLHCGLQDIKSYIEDQNILPSMFKHKLNTTEEVYNFDIKYDTALEKMNRRRIENGFIRIDLDAEKNMLFDLQQKAAKQQKGLKGLLKRYFD